MYELKAEDGNVYGPVDEGNILEWAKGGRIDGNSLVRKTPDGEWLPLNQIGELSYICRQVAKSPVPPTPPQTALGGRPVIPGKIQAISIMTLVGGIMALLTCLGLAMGTMFLYIPWVYSLVLGIMAIIKGSQMLGSNPARAFTSAKTIAIMQIVNIINCDVVNLTLGIVTLVFLNDPEVKEHLRSMGVEV